MDLNDLRYFALIVEHGGFSAAGRLTHIPKSKLSRRIALLEERLGVRLLQRTTRRLALTEAGRAFHEHCAAMLVEAEAAQHAVEQLRSEPSGTVRISCPAVMAQLYVAPLVASFLVAHPKVRVVFESTDRVVNLIEERVDLALRYRIGTLDEGLVARRLASGRMVLAASPAYLAAHGGSGLETEGVLESPQTLSVLDTIGTVLGGPEQRWSLVAADGRQASVLHRPRLLCSDFAVAHQATLRGVGVALLPLRIVWRGLEDGTLVRVAKGWATAEEDIHAVVATRRGMLPSVRALLEHLAAHLPDALAV